ncbi:unnamed protein product [Amoebophrya sp. A25]|nr:unnamed protein product [Amoebophrya sp. A25]CAD7976901.1 unnamed protein product [Amoebophrya sp. A25]CAD7976903.1 unnamed protein product [Amoebophrya sp. A25]|eukprot:GSA25T00026567001.1
MRILFLKGWICGIRGVSGTPLMNPAHGPRQGNPAHGPYGGGAHDPSCGIGPLTKIFGNLKLSSSATSCGGGREGVEGRVPLMEETGLSQQVQQDDDVPAQEVDSLTPGSRGSLSRPGASEDGDKDERMK